LLRKACHFVRLYPDKKALNEVISTGIDWMRLTLTFAISNKAKRHAVLRQAVREIWSQDDLGSRFRPDSRHADAGSAGDRGDRFLRVSMPREPFENSTGCSGS